MISLFFLLRTKLFLWLFLCPIFLLLNDLNWQRWNWQWQVSLKTLLGSDSQVWLYSVVNKYISASRLNNKSSNLRESDWYPKLRSVFFFTFIFILFSLKFRKEKLVFGKIFKPLGKLWVTRLWCIFGRSSRRRI